MDEFQQGLPVGPQSNQNAEPARGVDQILQEGRQQRAADVPAVAEQSQERPDAGEPGDRERKGWTFTAFQKEKEKRRQAQQRAEAAESELAELRANMQAQQPQAPNAENSFWMDPDGALTQTRIETNTRLSKAEFKAEYGKAALEDLEKVIASSLPIDHPEAYHLSQAMRASSDPIGVAAQWAEATLGWRPGQPVPQGGGAQHGQPAPRLDGYGRPMPSAFPSNMANVRNVGVRNGPGWSGPDSLKDIFDRRNRKAG